MRFQFLKQHGAVILMGLVFLVTISAITLILFQRSSQALEQQLRETLRSAAVAAAIAIDGDDLQNIRQPGDIVRPEFQELTNVLRGVVDQIPSIRFAYILRRTDDPDVLEFVVDADALSSLEMLDRNRNGVVDEDEEPSFPGDRYDIRDIPALQDRAFREPTTDPDITADQWGMLFSGYAPIRSHSTSEIVGVLGIDMDAHVFRLNTMSVLSPVGAMLIVLLACLLAGGIISLEELRQIRFLSRINKERSGLLQLTFHQLGEPITILQWALETLEDSKTDADALMKVLPENLTDMREGVRRLTSIIDTLQIAEKVELGVFKNKPVEESVAKVVQDTVTLVSSALTETGHTIETDVPPDFRAVFDAELLKMVLRQLIENALDFSKPGIPVRVRVKVLGKQFRIEVTDKGCGIPQVDKEHLFEKYFRASNATLMKPDGNGLGLYICRGLIERMGGTIGMESVVDVGTTVWVQLPVRVKPVV